MHIPSPRRLSSRTPLAIAVLVVGVLALGGTGGAVAGAMITGKQIKDNTVTTKDIKNKSLKGKDIKDRSLTGKDVKDSSLTSADLADETRMWGRTETDTIDDFTGTDVVIADLTFTTPAGLAKISADLYAEDDFNLAGTGRLSYRLRVDGKLMPSTSGRELAYAASGNDGATGAVAVVVPVTAGSHTVQLVVSEQGSGSFIYGRDLAVVYAPGGNTNAAIPARKVVQRSSANR